MTGILVPKGSDTFENDRGIVAVPSVTRPDLTMLPNGAPSILVAPSGSDTFEDDRAIVAVPTREGDEVRGGERPRKALVPPNLSPVLKSAAKLDVLEDTDM